MERAGVKVVARFPALSNNPAYADLLPVARLAFQGFTEGEYRQVVLAYTDFISGITQKPRLHELLPLAPDLEKDGGADYVFEPNPMTVLNRMLPALAETMTWHALLESTASEHAARMMAMRSASDAAKDMLSALTFTYNQARQASITQEIAEISSGKAALE
jgi:F-type H+-transporting ATPase subunit gamma